MPLMRQTAFNGSELPYFVQAILYACRSGNYDNHAGGQVH
jgi:hypothetical protein